MERARHDLITLREFLCKLFVREEGISVRSFRTDLSTTVSRLYTLIQSVEVAANHRNLVPSIIAVNNETQHNPPTLLGLLAQKSTALFPASSFFFLLLLLVPGFIRSRSPLFRFPPFRSVRSPTFTFRLPLPRRNQSAREFSGEYGKQS